MEHGCMVYTYTGLEPRRQQFHVAPAMPVLKYHFGDIFQKRSIKKKARHSCRTTSERTESAQESGE